MGGMGGMGGLGGMGGMGGDLGGFKFKKWFICASDNLYV
jgi:hypothetical protein